MPPKACKTMIGTVVSNKMMKTVVVAVKKEKRHPIYKKLIRVTKKYKAHCEEDQCHEGDIVKIEETRPLSKEKRWKVVEVISKAAAKAGDKI